jgi:hypothetical protein
MLIFQHKRSLVNWKMRWPEEPGIVVAGAAVQRLEGWKKARCRTGS